MGLYQTKFPPIVNCSTGLILRLETTKIIMYDNNKLVQSIEVQKHAMVFKNVGNSHLSMPTRHPQ